ncbi:GNAT family N-acetyltransferase [Microbacterium resistens]|uniref:GNAT family N-acetyltransferase n=1 Tax=Microbacterium resistens TaxID=156977 RepID=UPI001C564515|nr:GNAT family N-acetyltransferase [Microbacterium resistens]MBW1640069.1 GNAT family N-acetyltransferase [Microbacterium resistens]
MAIQIRRITPEDAGEVLTLQRAAFVSEALVYRDPDQPALTQTLEQVEAELRDAQGFVAVRANRILGAIRARERDGVLQIGRIAVAPDVQGEGIGRRLLEAIEADTDCAEAELFTGSLSEANIALYTDCGYREAERIDQGDGTAQVFLRKRLR